MNIGILALQGAFKEHKDILDSLGVDSYEISKKSDLKKRPEGLILPGGESTAIGTLLNDLDMTSELKNMIENGLKEGGGYTDLMFAKPGEKTPLPKRNYSLAFKPYNWIIGTGTWIDYIDNKVAE